MLVATPARLLFHVASTPGFTLEHLQFLVMDEVDKLLNEENSETIKQILRAYNDS